MRKVLIFGNSGSGKSTLAKSLCAEAGLAHLDLDVLAWEACEPPALPQRKPLEASKQAIQRFISENEGWVIEGCYADLLAMALPDASEMIFLNLTVEDCIANAKSRPWEPHKYPSKKAQDANLDMLIAWIADYAERNDVFSKSSHQKLFDSFNGKKTMLTEN